MLVEPEAGSLASAVAERAGRLGRPVFAVPGPVTTPGRDMARRRHHGEAIGAVRLFGEWAPIERDEPTPTSTPISSSATAPPGSSATPKTYSPT